MKIKKLGVFDSGIGGLSVLKELVTLPIAEFVYFADTKNLPYGEKSPEQIKEFTNAAVRFLYEQQQADAIVLACHTASAIALEQVQNNYPQIPIFGVVDPVVTAAVAATKNKRVGIIGTPATIASNIHRSKILGLNPAIQVFAQACPKLVPLIEAGKQETNELKIAIRDYLLLLQSADIDTLIIGCTHYELIKEEIAALAGPQLQLISAPEQLLITLKYVIGKATSLVPATLFFYVTSEPDRFMFNRQKIGFGHQAQKPIVCEFEKNM